MAKPIGEYLVEAGLLDQSQVEEALAEQRVTGNRFGDIVVARGWLQRQTIEYWMKNVIIPHRRATQPPQPSAGAKFQRKPPAPPPLPRVKPPEETLIIGMESVSVPPQPLPKVSDPQHQETLILDWKDLPPL
ncbi:MAG: hypothetical protein RMI89_01050 [Gloeomargarita sp. SKYBB_i_bin120]|nr:hypothetical protein [Gloeomargarita sp. SKYG98]MCS7291549.1 hypothetical protein [Gloeomargarita sp. SKYB120]MDW8177109.1 hypothetical protein [Gloeomargarita sp. SKYBB_i_bin120]